MKYTDKQRRALIIASINMAKELKATGLFNELPKSAKNYTWATFNVLNDNHNYDCNHQNLAREILGTMKYKDI